MAVDGGAGVDTGSLVWSLIFYFDILMIWRVQCLLYNYYNRLLQYVSCVIAVFVSRNCHFVGFLYLHDRQTEQIRHLSINNSPFVEIAKSKMCPVHSVWNQVSIRDLYILWIEALNFNYTLSAQTSWASNYYIMGDYFYYNLRRLRGLKT